ncbi:MAG: hypothetical protein QXT06_07370, partial [Candidatus Bathyarchaeia archaeon]
FYASINVIPPFIHFPLGVSVVRYLNREALNELKYLEPLIMARAVNLLKSKNYRGAAEMLISIDNEIYQTEHEARRLRLMGQLNYEVYRALMDGYVGLQRRIVELSEKHGLERDVKEVYSFLKLEASLANKEVRT